MNKINFRVILLGIVLGLILTYSILIVRYGSKEIKDGTIYKITWSEKGEDHELEFSPNKVYKDSGLIFYFDDNSEFESIVAQNGACFITKRDKTAMVISGNFVIEPY